MNISIIIPVYKDWNSLEQCIDSLIKYTDKSVEIIIINDRSDEWSDIEEKIKSKIKGLNNYKYFLNEENLGFVKTCNKGVSLSKEGNDILLLNSDTEVTEGFLEEMFEVLYLSEKHGVVSPRSNKATLLNIPFNPDNSSLLEPIESFKIFQEIKNYLPKYSIIPTAVGYCMLIKRVLIENYGLFDEIYGKGYNEENDFVMRLNEFGFSAVSSNYSWVYHHEGRSFGDRKKDLNAKNQKILLSRYPHYLNSIHNYLESEINPVDYFSGEIVIKKRPKVLLVSYNFSTNLNGTTLSTLNLVRILLENKSNEYEYYFLVEKDISQFFNLGNFQSYLIDNEDINKYRFDIVFSLSQIISYEQYAILNKLAPRISVLYLDIIALRSLRLKAKADNFFNICKDVVNYSDQILSISKFSHDDIIQYFNPILELGNNIDNKFDYIYLTGNNMEQVESSTSKTSEEYILIIGNNYPHKSISVLMKYIQNLNVKFKVLGSEKPQDSNIKNIEFIPSGSVEQTYINKLISNSLFVIFPSVYEGFGMPIFESVCKNKKVLVYDNLVNRELHNSLLNKNENIHFFKKFSEVPSLIETISANKTSPNYNYSRNWQDVSVDLEKKLTNMYSKKVDTDRLRNRWYYINNIGKLYKRTRELEGVIHHRRIRNITKKIIQDPSKLPYYLNKFVKLVFKQN
jgi:GT2 family glycosyltransferase